MSRNQPVDEKPTSKYSNLANRSTTIGVWLQMKKQPYCDIVSLHSDINVHQRTLVIFGTDVAERSFIQLFIFPPY